MPLICIKVPRNKSNLAIGSLGYGGGSRNFGELVAGSAEEGRWRGKGLTYDRFVAGEGAEMTSTSRHDGAGW
jgi:hypothetical protein